MGHHVNVGEDSLAVSAAVAVGGMVHRWWIRIVTPKLAHRRARKVFQDGLGAVPGVTDGVPGAPARLLNVEALAATTARSVVSLTGQFESFREETRTRLDGLFDAVTATYRVAESTNKEVKPNGGESPSLADTVQRMAKRSGDYVEPGPVTHDRRGSDKED